MKIIVGLGNPGTEYESTYHNLGWIAIDVLADKLGIRLSEKKCDSLVGVKSRNGEKIVLAKPLTYMNLSGSAVKQLLSSYKASLDDLIVIYDDIDILVGEYRFREKGSAGTHNGMRDIIAKLGDENFKRVRIGTGPVPEDLPLVAYVLQNISDENRQLLGPAVKAAAEKIITLLD
ncbi:MAG: aminoacyl-tRNA hydrolase [Clostridia bacterium]|nr:aminoacyl-tRNA hydrolase [Clostridia bacterium]MBP5648989.1 aminoacyl-tRNA hydrolase [Clostridia bacterium]